MRCTTSELAQAIRDYLEERSDLYVTETSGGGFRVEGTLRIAEMAADLMSLIDACPCDCDREVFTGRWTSGSFSGEGPLRSAYTCEEHSALVAAWCQLGTGLPPEYISAPAGDWRAGLAASITTEKEVTP